MLNYTIIYKKLNIDNYIKKTTSDLKQQIRTLYICSKKKKYRRGLKNLLKPFKPSTVLRLVKTKSSLLCPRVGKGTS